MTFAAGLPQSVERLTVEREVAGSIPGAGARFSKVPVTLRARNQIFKSKYKE